MVHGVKREQGSGDTMIIPIFSNINIMHAVLLSAKYGNNYCISTPLFPSFLHPHCLQILYTTNFLRENVL